ncbi:hypothetical protein KUTeg_011965 [Tegillarca granosa]|uniref:BTB domain-containing protein n=1 Tax=Tegillarca granosa TaxID=220873 RepID=A0ABQ9EY72_TEGGR|nr:hypothetical protein KUTeg_011965 [Tegillarca granosa]
MMDWQQGKSILQCISTLYLNERMSDVYFTFPHEPDKTPLPAHKFLLASRSPEFESLFYGNSPEVYFIFDRYLYTDDIDVDRDIVTPLLHASEKYQVTTLSKKCATYLESAVSVSNVCVIFEQASFFGLTNLVLKALRIIEENTEKVLKSKGFTSLSKASIGCILRSENLTAKEVSIFRAAMKWAAAECERKGMIPSGQNQRQMLGELFFHIRIPLLTLDEFTKYVVDTGVLTEREQLQLFKFFTCKSNSNRKDIPDFIDKPRKNGINGLTTHTSAMTSEDIVKSLRNNTVDVMSDVISGTESQQPITTLETPVPPLDLTPVTITPLLLDIQNVLGCTKDDQHMLITGDLVTDYKCINHETVAVFSNMPLKLTEITMLHTIKCASCENVIDHVLFSMYTLWSEYSNSISSSTSEINGLAWHSGWGMD